MQRNVLKKIRKEKDMSNNNWYGIKGLEFVWRGTQSDSGVRYKGVLVNATIPEDTMWDRFIRDESDEVVPERETDYDGFSQYMHDNADEVKELVIMAMEPVATYSTCNFGGIEILHIDSYGDYVITSYNNGECRFGIGQNKLYQNSKGDYFFKKDGHRYYISSFMRTK